MSRRVREPEPFEIGAPAMPFIENPAGRRADRKEKQLCRQVQEAVGEALASLTDELLMDIWVCDVVPAPDSSRLAVIVQAAKNVSPDEILERLQGVSGFLRSEVAAAITRKRVPQLTFQVLPVASSTAISG